MTPVVIGPPKPPPVPPAPAWIGRNVIAAKLIAARGLDLTATIELLRENWVVGGALFFLSGAGMDIAAQRQKLTRWLRQFRADDPDLAGSIASALRLPGEALTTLRNYIHEDHAEQPRSLWRHSRDRAVHDWAIDLIGPAICPRGSVTLAEAGTAATTIIDWIEAVDPFRPARTRYVVINWLEDLERRAQGHRLPPRRRDHAAPRQPVRAAPDPSIWAAAAEGRAWR
jgi:hypothetical protein